MALSPDHGRIFAAVLHGIFVISASILFILGISRARRHSDPARCGLPWLRAVFIFAIAGATLTILSYALTLHLSSPSLSLALAAGTPATIARVLRTTEAALYVSTVGTLLSLLSDIFLLVTLVEISRGFVLLHKPQAARLAHQASLVGAAVLGVLALVAFGLAVRYNRGVLAMARGEAYPASKVGRDTLAVGRVSSAVDIIMWVGSLGVVGWVVRGVVRGMGEKGKAVKLVLAAAVVTMLRALGLMVLAAMYGFDITTRVAPEVVFIVRPVVDVVPLLAVLGLLFAVSIWREGGLWSAGPVGQTSWYGRGWNGREYGRDYAAGETAEGYRKSHEISQGEGPVSSPEVKWS